MSGDTRFMRLFHHCKLAHISIRPFHHCKLAHVSMRPFHHCKIAHVSTTMTETVRLFYHYKWAHVSATRTSNRTSSLQVSTFPPTVGPCPEAVHGAIHLSPYISHHFYLIN